MDPHIDGILYTAAKEGDLETMKQKLNDPVDRPILPNGFTLLYIACEYNRLNICDLLIQHGADVNKSDNVFDATPLFVASENGHKEVCALLLDRGANVDQANIVGVTPLWIASQNGHKEVCALLLVRRANVDQANRYGLTPLFIASEHGHKEVCVLLIRHGAQTRGTHLAVLDDSITDALCQRPLVDLRETLVYRYMENLKPMIKIMRHVEFILLDDKKCKLFKKLLERKVQLHKDSIQNIISAQEIARGQLDSKDIQNEVMSFLYVRMAMILEVVNDTRNTNGYIESFRDMKFHGGIDAYKHPIEKEFDNQVEKDRQAFRRITEARARIMRQLKRATNPRPAKRPRNLHEEMNALRF